MLSLWRLIVVFLHPIYHLQKPFLSHPAYQEHAITMGGQLEIYRSYPASKSRTSPFAPIWIGEIVSRQD
jgi:hypothetical protein